MAESLDYYETLQVSPNAEPEVIDAAYRKLASKYHPDKNSSPDATRQMQNINVAYDMLKDPAKRRAYDQECAARVKRRTAQERHAQQSAASSANAQQHTSTGASANTSRSQQRTAASSGEQSRSHTASSGATGAADRDHSTAQPPPSSRTDKSRRKSPSPIEPIFREAWQRRVLQIRLEQEYEVRVSGHTYYIDFAHPATKTAIELDSYEFHAKTPDLYNATVERRQDLTRAGWEVYSITGRQINNRVDQCVDDVRTLIETRMRAQRSAQEAAAQERRAAPPPNPQPRTPPTPGPPTTAAPPPFTPPPPSNTQYHYVLHEVTKIYESSTSPAAIISPTSPTNPTPTITSGDARSASCQWAALPLWEQVLKLLAFTSSGAAAVMLGVGGFGVLVPLGGVETIPYLNVTSEWLIIALPALCLVVMFGICSVVYRCALAVWRQTLALGWVIASVAACVGVYMLLNRFAETRISLESTRNLVLLGIGVGALVPLPHHSFARVLRSIGCVIIGGIAVLLVSCLAVSIGLRWITTPATRPASAISSQAAQASVAPAEKIVRVTAQSLNVRAQPTVESDTVGLLHVGMELDVLDQTYDASDKRWLRVRQRASGFDKPVEGWVNASFVEPVP